MEEAIFREYDIRGIYREQISEEFAYLLGKAFVSLISKENGSFTKKISIGMDSRLSSKTLKEALARGITECGLDVVDLGLCPTPLQYYSIYSLDIDHGIMVTGSHNPPEFNGFKITLGKETIYGERIRQLKTIIEKQDFIDLNREGSLEYYDIINDYVNFMTKNFPSLEGLKIVIDSGNGTAGVVAPKIFRNLGAEVIELFSEPDGNFPNHHPDPVILENLQRLIETVKYSKAQFGIGYDGDADRLGVVDDRGEVVWGDRLILLFAMDILKKYPGAKIIGEVKCSRIMYEEIEKMGGIPIMWKTGHSLIKSKMKEENALLAGEMSGHIFFRDRYFGFDDAIYASLRLSQIIKEAGDPYSLSRMLSKFKTTCITPEIRIYCPDERKFLIIEKLKSLFNSFDCCTIDGIRINFPSGWALVRASNTQPALVLRFEADSEEELKKIKVLVHQRLFEVFQFFEIL